MGVSAWRDSAQGPAEHALADDRTAESHKRQVQLGAALIAGPQPAQVVQPGEAALDDPALGAQAGAVL
jgi:hypothetical protein